MNCFRTSFYIPNPSLVETRKEVLHLRSAEPSRLTSSHKSHSLAVKLVAISWTTILVQVILHFSSSYRAITASVEDNKIE